MAAHPAFSSPKQLLDARHLRPRKRFGQNFLNDPRIASRIAAALPEDAFILEIGGGTGTLTIALAGIARELVVVEIDRDLSALLRDRFGAAPYAAICLTISPPRFSSSCCKLRLSGNAPC